MPNPMKMKLMVLNDGETYTSLVGCRIVEVDDDVHTYEVDDILRLIDEGAATSRGKELYRFDGSEGES